MTQPTSVFDKAQALQAEAIRLQDGAVADAEAARLSNRVSETSRLLDALDQVVASVQQLQTVGGAQSVDLAGLHDGRANFARHAATGAPSDRVFTTAQQKIREVTDRVGRQLVSAWSAWTESRTAELPLVRLTLLEADAQDSARRRRDDLQKIAKKTAPTASDITLFQTSFGLLKEVLDEVNDPPADVLALLDRLGRRPSPTLNDLTDEQIALLRETGIANQIEVRRRGM